MDGKRLYFSGNDDYFLPLACVRGGCFGHLVNLVPVIGDVPRVLSRSRMVIVKKDRRRVK